MNNIKDNYTQGFPGVIKQISRLTDQVNKLDTELNIHLGECGIEIHEFGFKWIQGLQIREFKLLSTAMIAMDYFLSYGDKFDDFMIYVMIAQLMKFSKRIW